jgi:hypothetical protein
MNYDPESEGGGAMPPDEKRRFLSELIALGNKAFDRLSEEAIYLSAILFFKGYMEWHGASSIEVDKIALPALYGYLTIRMVRLVMKA